MSTEVQERRAIQTVPPRRWRNKMRAKEFIDFYNQKYEAGDLFQAGPDYPSRDAAETAAIDFLSTRLDAPRDDEILANVVEYLGAFPFDQNGAPI